MEWWRLRRHIMRIACSLAWALDGRRTSMGILLPLVVILFAVLAFNARARRRELRWEEGRTRVAAELERWAAGEPTSDGDWQPLVDGPFPDPRFEPFRQRLLALRERHAPEAAGQWCGPAGWPALRELAAELRAV